MPHKIWSVGEEVLAADFQTYLQDQVTPTFPNVAGRNTWVSPPKGALSVTTDTNTLWIYDGSAWGPVAAALPHGRVSRVAGLSLPHNTATAIPFDTQRHDVGGVWNPATPTRLIAPSDGFYMVGGGITFPVSTAGARRVMQVSKMGTVIVGNVQPTVSGGSCSMGLATASYASAGEYFEVIAFHDSGAAFTATGGEGWITATALGPPSAATRPGPSNEHEINPLEETP